MPKTKMVIINGRRYKQTDAARLGLLAVRDETEPTPEHKAVQAPAAAKPAPKTAAKKPAPKKNEAANDKPKPSK